MTRKFNSRIQCEHCGRSTTAESALERWIRNDPFLDSRKAGIVRFDCDILIHKYKDVRDKRGPRQVQCLMFVEAKAYGAEPSACQRDTLSMFSQVLRNRKTNRHQIRVGLHAIGHTPPAKVFSHILKSRVRLRLFGGHLFQMSGADPVSSVWLKWDRKPISIDQLRGLLCFDLDPDTLKPLSFRRRYSSFGDDDLFPREDS